MTAFSEILKHKPFDEVFVPGDTGDIVACVKDGKNLLIVALESDYLFAGVNVKNTLEAAGKTVSALSLDCCDEYQGGDFSEGFDVIIAIGEQPALDLVRRFAEQKIIVFIPTTLVFYYAFSPRVAYFENGLLRYENRKNPDVVFFDVSLTKKMKVRHVADGLCSITKFACRAFEYSALCVIKGKKDEFSPIIDSALALLGKISEKPYETIIKCQIYLGLAVFTAPDGDFLSDAYMAHVLSRVKSAPREECMLLCAEYLIKFYAKVLKKDISMNVIMPDYNASVFALSELMRVEPVVIFDDYKPLDEGEFFDGLNKIYSAGLYEQAVLRKKQIASYKRLYESVYKGKRKRLDVDRRTALAAALGVGLISDGLMKYFSDSGITGAVTAGGTK